MSIGADKDPPEKGGDDRPSRAEGKPDPLIGRTIAGRFTVLDVIARGGMGKVYRAEQAPLGRICALKILQPRYAGDEDPEFQRRFYLEAATAAKLTHPNTVTIFDYGRDGEIYFIAMEYVQGRTLYRVLREDGPLSEKRVAFIVRQVGRSLREAHAAGVIHRDMKPANVVLLDASDERDAVKVLDFGLVKDVSKDEGEDLTQQGMFMGSPKYMAPEQILGTPVSPRTDIYSLGVVAFELLTGQVPFDRGSSVKTLMAHLNEPVPRLASVCPAVQVSAAMEGIVLRCLRKDAAERYATIDELLAALAEVEGGGGVLVDSRLALQLVEPPSLPGARELAGGRESGSYPQPPDDETQPTMRRSVAPAVLIPSATPAPMHQDMLELRPRRRGWIVVAGVALAAAGLGAVALLQPADPEPPAEAAPTESEPSAAPEAVEPEPSAAPSQSVVTLDSTPRGARVHEDGELRCAATPCEIAWEDRGRTLTFSKAGFQPLTVELGAAQRSLAPKLLRATAPAPPTAVPAPSAAPSAPEGYKDSPY